MSEQTPIYNTTPRTLEFTALTTEQVEAERRSAYAYAFTGPALLTSHDLATLADTLAGERQSCEDEPATPLGYWPTAVAALLSHVEALTARMKEAQADAADAEREKLAAYEVLRRLRNTTTGTGLPGFTVPQAKGVAYWEPTAPEVKEVAA